MKEILLVGGGGHCKSCIDVIELENRYKIVGIVDKKEFLGQKVLGYEVIACDEDLPKLFKDYKYALVTVGQIKSSSIRKKIFNNLKDLGFELPIIVSPKAYVSKHSTIDEGTIIMHEALVNADAQIGKNCIINTKALIEHDAVVEDNCHISTASVVNGGVVVKSDTFVGSNATTNQYIEIESNSFIKAGSLQK